MLYFKATIFIISHVQINLCCYIVSVPPENKESASYLNIVLMKG